MKIGFVGFGNMASAMADGWIAAGVAAGDMCACAGRYDALVERCEARGMAACHDAAEVVAASDIVVAAVKPYMIEKVFAPLKDALADKVVLSVAWTWDSAKWEQVLPGVAHISTVPNTPVSVGEGVIACEKASTLSDDRAPWCLICLETGTVVELDSSLLFVGGTVGGCAPAFVAMAIEALGDAAVKHGIPRADAYRIVSQMVLGTAKLQLATGQHPAAMKDAVCSPGGATIKGVVALEDAGMRSALVKAIDATLQ
ncbi:MAG: pyrroline-5-carboxylate reductase [Collinsella sp.]